MSSDVPMQFSRQLAELLIERGLTRRNGNPDWSRFSRELPGVSYESLRKALTGERPVSLKIMRSTAKQLEVSPTVFYEYRLWAARRELDPATVGYLRTARALAAWERALAELDTD